MVTRFAIPFPPRTGNNQYGARKGGGKHLLPEVKKWREDCSLTIPALDFPTDEKILLSIMFYAPDSRKRDADNHLKPVLDALKTAWQIDDSRFDLAGVTMRVDSENSRVEIEIAGAVSEETDPDKAEPEEPHFTKSELGKQELKTRFIERRAAGFSLRKISGELGTAKSTLAVWDAELQREIAALRAEQLEALFEQYGFMKEQRVGTLGQILQKVKAEALSRDLTKVPSEKLLDLFVKLHGEAKDEVIGLQSAAISLDKIGTKLDIPELTNHISGVLSRYKTGAIDKNQVSTELEILESLIKSTELANLSERLQALETILKARKKS